MGEYDAPKRTAIVRATFPSTTHLIVLLLLSMQSARPVRHRASSFASVVVLPGNRLASSSVVGVRVIACSRVRVRRSTYPVTAIPRLAWKPFTAAVVERP